MIKKRISKKSIPMMERKIDKYVEIPFYLDSVLDQQKLTGMIEKRKFGDAYELLALAFESLGDEQKAGIIGCYILIRIAHIYIYSNMWRKARELLEKILKYPDMGKNPIVLLRLGQAVLRTYDSANDLREEDILGHMMAAVYVAGYEIIADEEKIMRKESVDCCNPFEGLSSWEEWNGIGLTAALQLAEKNGIRNPTGENAGPTGPDAVITPEG